MLSVLEGNVGTGKTLLSVILCFFANLNKKKIVCNFHLKGIKYELLDIKKFLRQGYENALIIIDEAYVYFESRTSMSLDNRLSSYILFQSRKKGIDIVLTFQLLRSIDIRFRELIDIYIKCNKHSSGYEYTYYNFIRKSISTKLLTFKNASKYFKFYDTYEIIQNDKMKIEIQSKEERNKLIEDYANYIIEHNEKPTRDNVVVFCNENEIPKNLISIIYSKMRVIIKNNKNK